jgi:hypothetical protein
MLGADLLNGDGARCTPLEFAVSLYQPQILSVVLNHLKENGMLDRDHAETVLWKHLVNGLLPTLAHEQDRIKLHVSNLHEMASATVQVVLEYWPGDKDALLEYVLMFCVSSEKVSVQMVMATYLVQVLFRAWVSISKESKSPKWIDVFLFRLLRKWNEYGDDVAELLDKLLEEFPEVIDLAAKNKLGRTVLHDAAIYNNTPLIPILLRHGADLETKDQSGHTPLGLAARMASAESFDTLIDSGAQVMHYSQDHGYTSVLHLAAQLETHKSLLPYMLFESRHRAMFTKTEILEKLEGGNFGLTPLAWCVICMHLEAIQALMAVGANCRAACWLAGWDIVLSVRELATLTRYKPELHKLGNTRQKEEIVDVIEQALASRKVQEMFYSGCKESDYEEKGFVESRPYQSHGGQLTLVPFVRERRPSEPFKQKYVSIDVLNSWSPNYGKSKFVENGLGVDELLQRLPMTWSLDSEALSAAARKDYNHLLFG